MRNIRLATVGAAIALAAFASSAQAADTASATASAEVLSTISVVKDVDMSFGQIAVNGDGTVALATDGSATCSANLVCAGTSAAAEFTVTGTAGVGVTASVDEASITLTHSVDGTKTFTVDTFDVGFLSGNTLVAGTTTFNVGGQLNVLQAMALPGTYSGTFNVTVEYQ